MLLRLRPVLLCAGSLAAGREVRAPPPGCHRRESRRRRHPPWWTVAVMSLWYQLVTSNFQLQYVASSSNQAMPWYYKVGALWGGQEGSLLFWCWILTLFSMVTVLVHRKRNPVLMPWVVGGGGHGDHLLPAGQQLRRQPLRRHRGVAGGGSAGALGSPRRPGTQPPAAILGHGDPPAHPLRGLRRIHRPLCLRHCRPDHPGTGRGMDPDHQAVDDGPPGCSWARGSFWAPCGLTWCWAGAATGGGTRWKTPP